MFKNSIRTQVPRFSGARLNRAHPLGAIAESVWYPADLSGVAAGSNIRAAPHADVQRVSRDGRPAFYNNDANETGSTATIAGAGAPLTLFAQFYVDAAPGFVPTVPIYLSGSSFDYCYIGCGSSSFLSAYLRFSGTARTVDITVTGGTFSKLLSCVFVIRSETDYQFWCNGQTNTGTASPGTPANQLTAASGIRAMNGAVLLSGYGRSVIPASYASWLSMNPDAWYEMFEPRRIWVPVPTAAPSGFLPAWIRRPQRTVGAGVI